MIEKPFSVQYRETQQTIVDIINQSGLPIDVVDAMLSVILTEVKAQANKLYLADFQFYNDSLSQQKGDKSEEKVDE